MAGRSTIGNPKDYLDTKPLKYYRPSLNSTTNLILRNYSASENQPLKQEIPEKRLFGQSFKVNRDTGLPLEAPKSVERQRSTGSQLSPSDDGFISQNITIQSVSKGMRSITLEKWNISETKTNFYTFHKSVNSRLGLRGPKTNVLEAGDNNLTKTITPQHAKISNSLDDTSCIISKPKEPEISQCEKQEGFSSGFIQKETTVMDLLNFDSKPLALEPETIIKKGSSSIDETSSFKKSNETVPVVDNPNRLSDEARNGVDPFTEEKSIISEQSVDSFDKRRTPCKRNVAGKDHDSPRKYLFNSTWSEETMEKLASSLDLPMEFNSRPTKQRKLSSSEDDHIFINEYFSKYFVFHTQFSNWDLPPPEKTFSTDIWKIDKFLDLKDSLNEVKNKLNDFPLTDWHQHTQRENRAGLVLHKIRQEIGPELLSQAWAKFYENVSGYHLIPSRVIEEKCLNSVHLCEAPGAFITSLNHYLKSNFDSDFKWNWRASSFNPYYEGNPLSTMINDDRFIPHTLDRWIFGSDKSGDIMKEENLNHLLKEVKRMGKIYLVTADGSVDCQTDPSEQENLVSQLHFCETVAALLMLEKGGCFLIKMFTFFECASICLMYLLNCAFYSVDVNKPVTSKEGNSEVYVICCDFKGIDVLNPWVEKLLKCYGTNKPNQAMFPQECIPESFLKELYKCAELFHYHQTKVINRNVETFKNKAHDSSSVKRLRGKIASKFLSRYKLKPIDPELRIVPFAYPMNSSLINLDNRDRNGSHNDSLRVLSMGPLEEAEYLLEELQTMKCHWPGDNDIFWIDFPAHPDEIDVTTARPITEVRSSKFCLGRLLHLQNRVRSISEVLGFNIVSLISQKNREVKEWPKETGKNIRVLDFRADLWTALEVGNVATYEKGAFHKIVGAVELCEDGDSLDIHGFPLLTQFNVGIVFLLAHLFDKIGFVRPKGQDTRILFENYDSRNYRMKATWDCVTAVINDKNESELSVLTVVPIKELSSGDFYKYVTKINHICVQEQLLEILKNILSAPAP